jgi:two-component system sensor histidine kinase HydH
VKTVSAPEHQLRGAQLEQAMRALSRVSDALAESYRALAQRAERVEEELCRTHAELERVLESRAALGNMAGGIAHELRNPMNAIKGFAALLAPRLPEGSRERAWAALIVEGVTEADAILTSMLSLAAPDSLLCETIAAEALLDEAIAMATRDMAPREMDGGGSQRPADERWIIASGCTLAAFAGDRIKLRQALRNLITNAMQAQPEGGELQVSIAREGDEVVLRVRDAGPGIPPELVGRVFDPFFTTRPEGTGLGLALTSTIARLHGGRVDVSRSPAPLGGADVSLRIPYRS